MSVRIQIKRDTAANWTTNDPTLLEGELGYETDTGKFKIGDGSSLWSALSYFEDASDITETVQDAVGAMIADTNTVDLTYTDAEDELKADVLYQNTNSVDLSDDASGLKADVNVQNGDNTTASIDASGVKIDVSGTLDCGDSDV